MNNQHPRAQNFFRNEENLKALLIFTSFKRGASSGFRILPYPLLVAVERGRLCSNDELIWSHSVCTTGLEHKKILEWK